MANQQLNNSTTHQLILFTGNLVPVKGPDILLKAFAILCKTPAATPVWGGCPHPPAVSLSNPPAVSLSNPPVDPAGNKADGDIRPTPEKPSDSPHLIIIGSGPMRETLEQMARELGVFDQVHFLGRLAPEKVALWMNRADVLCLSSHSEGMPNVVLEARASGLPVVATPAGMIPEIPLDAAHFLVVPSCTPEALALGLAEMLSRDRGNRKSDSAIPTWAQQADKVLQLIGDR